MFSVQNYLILFAVLIALTFLYKRMEDKRIKSEDYENYQLIQQFLLNDTDGADLGKIKKPILWIHVPYEYNARNWLSFGSRSSHDLNQPYLYLTTKSVIRHCKDSFHICVIDDESFSKLLPGWDIDVKGMAAPLSCKVRSLGLAKLLYMYGGISLPVSFLCLRDLLPLYNDAELTGNMFVGENVDRNVSATHLKFYPDAHFLGATAKNEDLGAFIHSIEELVSRDFTAESALRGEMNQWLYRNPRVKKIDGTLLGVKNMESQSIGVEQLLGSSTIDFDPMMYGIWIPEKEILSRRQYEWFARSSPKQVISGSTILSRYFALEETGFKLIESMHQEQKDKKWMTPMPWVSFWKVSSDAPLYGMRPLGQGDESVLAMKN
jgi:hypothetical protein